MQNVVIRSIERLDFRTKEAYKTLRTNLSFAGKNVKVISLTSCTPNEGKTSVSFQLCLSLAESGKKTILVDADLRKSVLRGRYKASREKYGLSHYLSGQMELDDVCCRTNVNNFDIIFAGPIPPNPSELLGGDAFKNMLEVLRMKYDYVIVDAICDGTVLVVESGAISYKFAQNVKEQLDKVGCRILGCVLNKVNTKKNPYYGKYYGYYYGSYYGYGNGGADEAQDELLLDAGSKTDATASETGTAAPQQSTEEKGDAK